MAYYSRRQLEAAGEAIGDLSGVFGCRRILHGGGKGSAPPPPDYRPMAAASEESARIGAELGREQLAENRRQYDETNQVARPIIDAQAELLREQILQGKAFQDQQNRFQPLESALIEEARAAGTPAEQEVAANRAIADVRQGTTQAQNQLARQGLRYGWSPAKIAAAGIGGANQQGLAAATAANGAREQEKMAGFAKRMDVSGLGRGLVGASQGAYGMAMNAGNSAVSNRQGVASQYLNGMAAGNQTIMGGQGMKLQGMGNVLGAQQNMYNTQLQAKASGDAAFMNTLGTAAGIGAGIGLKASDRRLKENIKRVGCDPRGFGFYEFNYKDIEDKRFMGVMADEVEMIVPDAVVYDDMGFASVNYDMLGIRMVEV